MVRTYKRKTTRGDYGDEALVAALEAVGEGKPLLQASNMFKISRRTLARHRDQKVRNPGHTSLGNYKMALDVETENQLHGHIKYMEKCLYGLTTTDLRKLAFEYAVISKLNHPFNTEKKMAGKDWLRGYLTRYPDLSIRTPQATSIQRAVGFNRPKVDQFYATYKNLLDTHTLSPSRIYNMDETGITEVHKPGKVIASKGARQVGKITSAERGSTVTLVCAMSAVGTYLPPMYIFPRKRMVEVLMNGAPPQSVGYVSDSGWTDSELFVKWLEHFVAITNASTNAQHAIIMDGHQSHKTLAAVNFARRHGIHLLTLPPHSTHKMQPLDRTFFKALKSAYNAEADSWMVSNPGRRITHYDIAGISGKAFLRTATPDKAIKGFECCGLWPFDANIFTENDFAPAYLTEEPAPADAADDTNVANPSASTSTTAAHPAPSMPVAGPSASTPITTAAHPAPSMPVAGPSASTPITTAAHPAPSMPVAGPSASTPITTAAHPAPSMPVAGPSASTSITTAAHLAPSMPVAGPSASTPITTAAHPAPSMSVAGPSASTLITTAAHPAPSMPVAGPSASTLITTAAHPAPSMPVAGPSASTPITTAAYLAPSMHVAGPSASTPITTAAHPAPSMPVAGPSASTPITTAAHPAPSMPVAGPSASTLITTAAHPAPSMPVAGPSVNTSATTAALPSSASVCNTSASIRQLIERISPRPKATCSRQRKRKVESAAVITSSPYKKLLQEKEQKKKSSQKKTSGKGKGKAKGKGKGKGKRKAPAHDDSSEDEEWPCLICGEPFVNSKSREMWVQCLQCKNWAHSDCTDESVYFVCPNCESDLEE